MTADVTVVLAFRYAGAGSIGLAILLWLARDIQDAQAQRAIGLGVMLTAALGVLLALNGVLSGMLNVLGWSLVVIDLLLTLSLRLFLVRQATD